MEAEPREVAVEAGEQRIAGEIDLVFVEGGVGPIPIRVRDGCRGCRVQLAEATQLDWVSTVVKAQNDFVTEINAAYLSAARDVLK